MPDDVKWRFPSNGGGVANGTNTGDVETFKKNDIGSLAREVVQNSIDAKKDDSDCVIVEFKTFTLDRKFVPGIDSVQEKIQSAYEWRKDMGDENNVSAIEKQLYNVKKQEFKCLRISDFNTTGLTGISSLKHGSKYSFLVKEEGSSWKGINSGGSKGVGKNATYINSNFQTIFYSSYTEDEEKGFIGVSKLSSAPIEGTDEQTSGTGFYGDGNNSMAVCGLLNLDPNFNRTEYGTDIYIIDFKFDEDWDKNIIQAILDSFMYAILKQKLVVKVGEYTINSSTLPTYAKPGLFLTSSKKDMSIIAQYEALTSGVEPYEFNVEDLGSAKLYFLDCGSDELHNYGNKKCTIIRYPYMKIKDEPFSSFPPFTAVCVIENNKLCQYLRYVENPQHENFEFGRLPKEQREFYKSLYYTSFLEKIEDYIKSKLSINESEETEFYGAEEFFHDTSNKENGPDESRDEEKEIHGIGRYSLKKRKAKVIQQNRYAVPDEEGESIIADIVGDEDSKDEIPITEGHNKSENGSFHIGDNFDQAKKEGDSKEGIRVVPLRGNIPVFIGIDKKRGHYLLRIKPDLDLNSVRIEIKSIDESFSKDPITILSAKVNGSSVPVYDEKFINVSFVKDKELFIDLILDQDDYFSAGVVCYENR